VSTFPTIENGEDVLQWVRSISYENGERLRVMSYQKQRAYVRKSIAEHEVVWLAWEDDDQFYCFCIKGRGRLGELSTTAFYVASRMDAISLAEEYGDGWPGLHEMPSGVM
jgi:hypothetical protein